MRIIIIILGDIFGTQVIKTRSTYLSIYVMFRPRCGFIWIVSVLLWEKLRIEAVAVVHCSHWSMTEVMISGLASWWLGIALEQRSESGMTL